MSEETGYPSSPCPYCGRLGKMESSREILGCARVTKWNCQHCARAYITTRELTTAQYMR